MLPLSIFPKQNTPWSFILSKTGILTGPSTSLWGTGKISNTSKSEGPVYHAEQAWGFFVYMLSPLSPEIGTKVTSF